MPVATSPVATTFFYLSTVLIYKYRNVQIEVASLPWRLSLLISRRYQYTYVYGQECANAGSNVARGD